MKTTIIIAKPVDHYISTVSGRYGEGHEHKFAGNTAEEAAGVAMQLMDQFLVHNPEGGELIAPLEVKILIPGLKIAENQLNL